MWIRCEDGVVVGCDSRTTEPDGHIRDNALKMLPVEFSDGSQALVAGAGNAIYANKAIEMILMRVKDKELTDYQTLPDCAQSVIKEIKGHIRESAGPATFNELQQLYADYSFQQRHTWWRKLKK